MSDIFISYKREDQDKARLLSNALKKRGWSVWWDPRLRAGQHFDDAIETALEDARCVIVLWSNLSVHSRYVKDESSYALRRDKLIPIAIEKVDVPFRFEGLQTPLFVDWDGSDQFPPFKKLVNDISAILAQSSKKPAETQQEQTDRPEKEKHIQPLVEAEEESDKEPAPAHDSRKWITVTAISAIAAAVFFAVILMLQRQDPVSEKSLQLNSLDQTIKPSAAPSDETREEIAQDTTAPPDIKPSPQWPDELSPDCDGCPELVIIPPGSFLQGSAKSDLDAERSEAPQHKVQIDYPLAVGRYEVTIDEFRKFTSETGHNSKGCTTYDGTWSENDDFNWQNPGFTQQNNHPVTCVSWNDAQAYTKWLSNKTGHRYRLLSSSEWEYTARASSNTLRFWGDDSEKACQFANVADATAEQNYKGWNIHTCTDSFIYTSPVGSFRANDFGLHDMLGNIFEWVEDCWNESYQGAPANGTSWANGDCTQRILRGGSWFSQPGYVRTSFRNRFNPNSRSSTFGFRVARELEP